MQVIIVAFMATPAPAAAISPYFAMRPFIGWSATVVIALGRSQMGSSCPLLSSPAVRRRDFFCFYGIAAAMGLRHTNGNIGVTVSNIRPERFSFSLPLLQFQNTFLAVFRKIVLQDEKERSALQTVHEKSCAQVICSCCVSFCDMLY